MLPLSEPWYRKQLVAAVYLGVFGGIFALAFSLVTTWAIDRLFGDATSDHGPVSGGGSLSRPEERCWSP